MNPTFNVAAAKAAGYTDQEISAFMAQQKLSADTPSQKMELAPPPVAGGERENKLRETIINSLPLIGGVAGSFIPGLGTIVGGATGAGLGALLKEGADDKEGIEAGNIAKEAILGGVGGVVGKGISTGSRLLTKGSGKLLEKTGESVALKTFRPTKTQLTNFAKLHGEDMAQTITRTGVAGKSADEIAESTIKPLQDQFNSIAKTSGLKVSRNEIDNKALQYIDRLLKSPSKEDHVLAEKLLEEYDFAMKSMGDVVDISKLDAARRTFDGKVKNWGVDPIQAGKNRVLGKIFRESTQEAADKAGLVGADGKSLKEIGLELNKLYDLRNVAELQENLGRGNLPVGLTDLLAFGSAGSLGAGPVGGVVAVGAKVLANNPRAMQIYSKLAQKGGQALQQLPTIPPLASTIAGQTLVHPGAGSPEGVTDSALATDQVPPIIPAGSVSADGDINSQEQQGNTNNHMDGTIPQSTTNVNNGEGDWVTGYSPEELGQAYAKALTAGDKAAATQLKSLFDMEVKYQESQGGAKKPPTVKQTQLQAAADGARQALSLLEGGQVTTGPIAGRIEGIKSATVGTSATQQDFMGTVAIARSALLNAYLGGNIPPSEYERISAGIPTANDPETTAKQKLITFIREVERVSSTDANPDMYMPDIPQIY